MGVDRKIRMAALMMIAAFVMLCATVAGAAPWPDAPTLAASSPAQLLAWMVVIEAGVIVTMAGVIVQAYRNRVKALEKQVEACRKCASDMADAMRRRDRS